ncbi:MAG: CCA tRNA nucleotidyltransferase [Clostridia bacterium]|nr:CCA tRNA nucleotidyltransferase [Clostridia bacterium]
MVITNFLPLHAQKAIATLEKSGFEAYAVGGCVRDFLLCREFFDIDIATSATPSEILSVFSEYKTIETGLKHGTVTVLIDSHPIEITSFRIDGEYSDNRHPEKVSFTKNLLSDLERRDFTVNAIAYNEKTSFFDPFEGRKDIKKRIIRCVGDPEKRFSQDALRILRALRFSSCLSFEIEGKTAEAICEKKDLLNNIASERINKEFSLLICGENAHKVLDAFSPVFDIFAKGINTSQKISSLPPYIIPRLCGILYFLPLENSETILKNLKYDKKTISSVLSILSQVKTPLSTDLEIKKCLAFLKEENFRTLIELKSLFGTENFNKPFVLKALDHIISQKQCLYISDLKVDGNDLISLGYPKGKIIGETLNLVLNQVLEGNIPNNRQEIMDFLHQK